MIRSAVKEDLNNIMDIWLNTNISAHKFVPRDYWESCADNVRGAILDAEVLVYEENKSILGFVGLIDEYIAGIFVKDGYQSLGIGSKLIAECKNRHDVLRLDVFEKNIRAIEFYKKEGFEVYTQKVNEYTDEAEYTMQWRR